jgi:hypothetical protein
MPINLRYTRTAKKADNSEVILGKKNNTSSTYLLSDEEKEDERQRDENEVKRLNMWEQDHHTQFSKKTLENSESDRSQKTPATRKHSILFVNQVKENINKLNIKSNNSKLNDFNNRTDEG